MEISSVHGKEGQQASFQSLLRILSPIGGDGEGVFARQRSLQQVRTYNITAYYFSVLRMVKWKNLNHDQIQRLAYEFG